MRIFRDLNELAEFKNSVVTIGTFDGVHIGHQKILKKLNNEANSVNGESILFTFYPHPRMVVFPDSHNLKLIQTIDEKIESLSHYGLDNVIIYPFTKDFSRLTAFEFVRDILVDKLKVKKLVIGYDHQFGRNREGNIEFLRESAEMFDFEVIEISAQEVDEVNVSSTKIRNSILDGNIDRANDFLGRCFRITGEVVKGNRLGRELGFPTLNLRLSNDHKIIPAEGVYAGPGEGVHREPGTGVHREPGAGIDEVTYADDTICISTDTKALNAFVQAVEETGYKYGMKLNKSNHELLTNNPNARIICPDNSPVKKHNSATKFTLSV